MLSPSSASWPLLLLLFSDLLCANSPIPAEASLWACDSGVPGVLPRVLCKARDLVSPEDSRERLSGEFAAALDLHHRTVSSQTVCSSTCRNDVLDMDTCTGCTRLHQMYSGRKYAVEPCQGSARHPSWSLDCRNGGRITCCLSTG